MELLVNREVEREGGEGEGGREGSGYALVCFSHIMRSILWDISDI